MYWMRFNKNIFYTCKTNNTPLRCRILNSTGLLSKSVKLANIILLLGIKGDNFTLLTIKFIVFGFLRRHQL